MQFLIQECVFGDRLDEAKKIIEEMGDTYLEIKGIVGVNDIKTEPVFCPLTSLSWSKHLGYYKESDYKVTTYLNHLSDYYINSDAIFLPFWALKNPKYKARIFHHFNDPESLFIKPDSGFKLFTGFDLLRKDWDKEIGFLNSSVSDNSMIIVSSYKKIEGEYRFFVINNRVVTYSSYSWEEEEYKNVPMYAQKTAEMLAKQVKHIQNFTLDLCYTRERAPYFEVVDLNSLYSSGIYNCDLKRLFTAMKEHELAKEAELALC